ncbi:MAG: HNH endonuclease [Allosphingosinicella sp.]
MARPFYQSVRWRRIAATVRSIRPPICAICGAHGARHVDHIMPRKAGGRETSDNLQLLCGPCHARKTDIRDGGFGRARRPDRSCGPVGCDTDGMPLDPGHWWNKKG